MLRHAISILVLYPTDFRVSTVFRSIPVHLKTLDVVPLDPKPQPQTLDDLAFQQGAEDFVQAENHLSEWISEYRFQ